MSRITGGPELPDMTDQQRDETCKSLDSLSASDCVGIAVYAAAKVVAEVTKNDEYTCRVVAACREFVKAIRAISEDESGRTAS